MRGKGTKLIPKIIPKNSGLSRFSGFRIFMFGIFTFGKSLWYPARALLIILRFRGRILPLSLVEKGFVKIVLDQTKY